MDRRLWPPMLPFHQEMLDSNKCLKGAIQIKKVWEFLKKSRKGGGSESETKKSLFGNEDSFKRELGFWIFVQLGIGFKLNTEIGLHTTHNRPPQKLFEGFLTWARCFSIMS